MVSGSRRLRGRSREVRVEDVVRDQPGAVGLAGPDLDELPGIGLGAGARRMELHPVAADGGTHVGSLVHRDEAERDRRLHLEELLDETFDRGPAFEDVGVGRHQARILPVVTGDAGGVTAVERLDPRVLARLDLLAAHDPASYSTTAAAYAPAP